MRAKRLGLKRNAIVALGNAGDPAAIPALHRVLLDPAEAPMLREHAAWALGRFSESTAKSALRQAREQELPPEVRAEVEAALRSSGSPESAHDLQQTERANPSISASAV